MNGKSKPSAPPRRPRYANPNHPMNREGKPIIRRIPTPKPRPSYNGVTGSYSSDK